MKVFIIREVDTWCPENDCENIQAIASTEEKAKEFCRLFKADDNYYDYRYYAKEIDMLPAWLQKNAK